MKSKKLDIIYEDKELIVINKATHLLTIANESERTNTLYRQVSDYVKKQHKSNKVYIVHRLDKDTSGVIVFAKNQNIKNTLQNNWKTYAKVREYIAIVEGSVTGSGKIVEYLKETKTLLTYATHDKSGDEAITEYTAIKTMKDHSILKINIHTGRKNQIRVAMKNMEHPIIGDKKYGGKKKNARRLCLHASRLVLIHPTTKKELELVAKIPEFFKVFE